MSTDTNVVRIERIIVPFEPETLTLQCNRGTFHGDVRCVAWIVRTLPFQPRRDGPHEQIA